MVVYRIFLYNPTILKVSKKAPCLKRMQRATARLAKGLGGLTYEERRKALKLQPIEKRRLRNDLVLPHKILYSRIHLGAPQLFTFSRRPGLRRPSIRLLHQTGRTRKRRNSFACRVSNNWNRLPVTVASVTEQRKFKKTIELIYFIFFLLYFRPNIVILDNLFLSNP